MSRKTVAELNEELVKSYSGDTAVAERGGRTYIPPKALREEARKVFSPMGISTSVKSYKIEDDGDREIVHIQAVIRIYPADGVPLEVERPAEAPIRNGMRNALAVAIGKAKGTALRGVLGEFPRFKLEEEDGGEDDEDEGENGGGGERRSARGGRRSGGGGGRDGGSSRDRGDFGDMSDQPATDKQKDYLRTLGKTDKWIAANIHNKQEASDAITELKNGGGAKKPTKSSGAGGGAGGGRKSVFTPTVEDDEDEGYDPE